jgi:hypothetical protein
MDVSTFLVLPELEVVLRIEGILNTIVSWFYFKRLFNRSPLVVLSSFLWIYLNMVYNRYSLNLLPPIDEVLVLLVVIYEVDLQRM